MKKTRILCYGDSNTYGAIPVGDFNSFKRREERYTKLLQNKLGENFEVIEEGLIGRTAGCDDYKNLRGNRNGQLFFNQCVFSHDPIDYLVIMLGTNDTKKRFNKSIKEIAESIENGYIKNLQETLSTSLITVPKIIIIAPPEIFEIKERFEGAKEKSLKFNEEYEKIALRNNCLFLNNTGVEVGEDGVHISANGHKILAEKLANLILEKLWFLMKEKSIYLVLQNY